MEFMRGWTRLGQDAGTPISLTASSVDDSPTGAKTGPECQLGWSRSVVL